MVAKPIVKEFDIATQTEIEREMSDTEFSQWQIDEADTAAKFVAIDAAKNAKAALLEKLGITEEEAKLLFS